MGEKIINKRGITYTAAFCLMILIVFLLAGCGNRKTQSDLSSAEQSSENQSDKDSSAGQSVQGGLDTDKSTGKESDAGVEEAKKIVLQDAGLDEDSVTFIKTDLDYDDGRTVYEIEFVTNKDLYEYKVKSDNGEILKTSKEPVEQIAKNMQGQDIITVEEAKEAALNRAGLSAERVTYGKVELDNADGQSQYEIEFYADGIEYDCTINAVSGIVLEMETE